MVMLTSKPVLNRFFFSHLLEFQNNNDSSHSPQISGDRTKNLSNIPHSDIATASHFPFAHKSNIPIFASITITDFSLGHTKDKEKKMKIISIDEAVSNNLFNVFPVIPFSIKYVIQTPEIGLFFIIRLFALFSTASMGQFFRLFVLLLQKHCSYLCHQLKGIANGNYQRYNK